MRRGTSPLSLFAVKLSGGILWVGWFWIFAIPFALGFFAGRLSG